MGTGVSPKRIATRNIVIQFTVNGDGEIRTHDPLLARQVLSQLSYTPEITIILLGYDTSFGFYLIMGYTQWA